MSLFLDLAGAVFFETFQTGCCLVTTNCRNLHSRFFGISPSKKRNSHPNFAFLKIAQRRRVLLPNLRCEPRFPFYLISALCKALVSICWSLGFPPKLWSFQSPWLCFIHFFLSVGDLGSFSHQLNQRWSIGSLHLSNYLVLLVGCACCGLETSLVWCARLALAWQWWFRGDKKGGKARWRRLQKVR